MGRDNTDVLLNLRSIVPFGNISEQYIYPILMSHFLIDEALRKGLTRNEPSQVMLVAHKHYDIAPCPQPYCEPSSTNMARRVLHISTSKRRNVIPSLSNITELQLLQVDSPVAFTRLQHDTHDKHKQIQHIPFTIHRKEI